MDVKVFGSNYGVQRIMNQKFMWDTWGQKVRWVKYDEMIGGEVKEGMIRRRLRKWLGIKDLEKRVGTGWGGLYFENEKSIHEILQENRNEMIEQIGAIEDYLGIDIVEEEGYKAKKRKKNRC